MQMKKFLLTAVALIALAPQAHADRIDDSFSELEGTWCVLQERVDGKEITIYSRKDPVTKKPCSKTGSTTWITINRDASISGSEHTCKVQQGGDFKRINVKPEVSRMVFSFVYQCTAEGYRWSSSSLMWIDGDGNLKVGVAKK
jgi:hypothetical protein